MSRWRYIAQRVLTNAFLEWDVPLERDELSWALSGAGSLRGTVRPDVGALRAADGRLLLEEWGTLLYAEADGVIRWGGIVVNSKFEGASYTIEAAGFATYPHGITYTDVYSQVQVDPADVFEHLWHHVQVQPDANLGVGVDKVATPVRLGEPARTEPAEEPDGEPKEIDAEPYELTWWEAPDCGDELDSLAKDTPFDYVERHYWNGDTEQIIHKIEMGYPRLGRRRHDLRFIQGDNVVDVVTVTAEGDDFANAVIGIGAGEGPTSVQRSTAVRDGRLRRTATYTDKAVTDPARMDARIADELARRTSRLEVTEVIVHDHPHAPIGSWQLGDDVLIEAELPWLGEIAIWSRITGWSLHEGDDVARLTLARSDKFRYGAGS